MRNPWKRLIIGLRKTVKLIGLGKTVTEEFDVVVVGTGAAGLTAALTASRAGLNVLVLEKTPYFGGTTSLSGGVMWIPNNHLMAAAGIEDSPEEALTYLRHNIGNRVPESKLQQLVEKAPEMLKFMTDNRFLEVDIFKGFPDYRAETPGGKTGGRSIEPRVFRGNRLGSAFRSLRKREVAPPMVGTMTELRRLAVVRSDFSEFLKAWKVIPRNFLAKLTGGKLQATGGGLIGWLGYALQKQKVPLWLNCQLTKVLFSNGRVTGLSALKDGEPVEIRARYGVILAAGGFDHNREMRAQHFGRHGGTANSSGSPGNEGDAVASVSHLNVAFDLMDDAWWAPTCLPPDTGPQIVIFERGKPGQIIVSKEGQRFANEAQPYADLVRAMFDADHAGLTTLPSYMIFDQRYRDAYPLAGMMPGITPSKYIDSGFLKRADSIESLAEATGISPSGLVATVQRFNDMAKEGRDEDFQRGEFAFDQFSGDNTITPNNCLAPIVKPPFYAMEIHPGDLGTRGGILTNESAQAMTTDGNVVEGLYAAGNCSACVVGNFYPGAGGTIGPAMTYGYIAARHIAENSDTLPE